MLKMDDLMFKRKKDLFALLSTTLAIRTRSD